MKHTFTIVIFLLLISASNLFSQEDAELSFFTPQSGEFIVVINSDFHDNYGAACPLTYMIEIPQNSSNLKVMERHSTLESWSPIIEKTSSDTFNLIEAVRFDYQNNLAYVSAAFSGIADTLYLKILNSSNENIPFTYKGISKYYDNRQAAVTITFDDWQDAFASMVPPLVHLFRSHGLYLTGAVITGFCNENTWNQIQSQVDSGYIEIASHSRNHLHTPYTDPAREVNGSYEDIINNLTLAPPFSAAGKEYVYTWIAPYGDYDSTVDSLLQFSGYLAPRIYANLPTASPRIYFYGDSTFSSWDSTNNHFKTFYPTVELGAPSWGGGDTSLVSLNSLFDAIVQKGGIYHCMWHPQTLAADINKRYLLEHLDYISGHKNIWYANLGILYLYHLVQMANVGNSVTAIASANSKPAAFELSQNYPNPFNPSTVIGYQLPASGHVTLKIYDILGRETATLVNKIQPAGNYKIEFSAKGGSASGGDGYELPSGIYLYELSSGNFHEIKKMILLK